MSKNFKKSGTKKKGLKISGFLSKISTNKGRKIIKRRKLKRRFRI